MTPNEERNARLATRMVKALARRGMQAYYCATAAEAAEQVSALIADGSTVTWGGSATVAELGLPQKLHQRSTLTVLDRAEATTPDEVQQIYLKAFTSDVYLTSANAITEDGIIVNIDGSGNRVAAITWGPRHVIFVVGMNKVATDLDAAVARARHTAAPINAMRFDLQTPCRTDGTCHDCLMQDSICSYIHILRHSRGQTGRHIVVLVGEALGF